MISFLDGKIEIKGKNYAVVSVNGIGYRVFASPDTLSKMPQQGSPIKLFTALEVKEDAMDLYGFITNEELGFYEMLRTVSGVGPKTAMAIISLAPLKMLASAIAGKNADFITKASGVGRKTAERIIIDLKDKAKDFGGIAINISDTDLLEALTKMGYGIKESAEALGHVPQEIKDEQARLKEALKMLNHKK